MRSSLFWKLLAAFAIVILVGIGGALAMAGKIAEVEFRRYAGSENRWQETASELGDYYATNGDWNGVADVLTRGHGRGQGREGGPPVRLADSTGDIVFAQDDAEIGQRATDAEISAGLPIVVDGEQVGTLLPPVTGSLTDEQELFLDRLIVAFTVAGGAALAVALALGALLVRGITRPLAQLTAASRAVASGALETRVDVHSRDEVGQLASAFNQMAADLAHAEEARRQQVADIAHELRTPLTVIQGQMEALVDGIFPADAEHLGLALAQTHLLTRLVEDLRMLSLADAGQLTLSPAPVAVGEWVTDVTSGFRAVAFEQGISLHLEADDDLPRLEIDPGRMSQVLGNVMDNALRHTPKGGRVAIRAARRGSAVVITVTDTGPGVTPEHLPHLFERFWRGDPSRSRRTGGSGLGLAIARRIVEAHGGRIWAENPPDGGLRISFSLPGA